MTKEITKYRKLSELVKLPGNPRTIKDDSFQKLVASIKANPDYFEARPVILSDRTGELVILAGNQRYEAAKSLKLKEIPTFLIKDLTEEREREIIIRLYDSVYEMRRLKMNFYIKKDLSVYNNGLYLSGNETNEDFLNI